MSNIIPTHNESIFSKFTTILLLFTHVSICWNNCSSANIPNLNIFEPDGFFKAPGHNRGRGGGECWRLIRGGLDDQRGDPWFWVPCQDILEKSGTRRRDYGSCTGKSLLTRVVGRFEGLEKTDYFFDGDLSRVNFSEITIRFFFYVQRERWSSFVTGGWSSWGGWLPSRLFWFLNNKYPHRNKWGRFWVGSTGFILTTLKRDHLTIHQLGQHHSVYNIHNILHSHI